MIRLSTMSGQPDVVKFPGGQNAPADSPVGASADVIVPAPEGNSVLVANPADRVIYYYSEGMAAPMGSFQNYRRNPRAVMVIDRSLREISSGVYSTTTKLPKSGIYDVAFLLDSPRVTHCFSAEAKPNPDVRREKQVALRIEYLNDNKQPRRRGELQTPLQARRHGNLKSEERFEGRACVDNPLVGNLAETRLRSLGRRRRL